MCSLGGYTKPAHRAPKPSPVLPPPAVAGALMSFLGSLVRSAAVDRRAEGRGGGGAAAPDCVPRGSTADVAG